MRINATTRGATIIIAKGGGVLIEDGEMFSTFATGSSNTTNSSFTVGNNEGPIDDVWLEDNRFTGGDCTARRDGRGQTR